MQQNCPDVRIADLKRIKQQAFVFVRSILHNLKRFVDGQSYAKGA